MAEVIAGRDAELASLRDFVESVSGGAVSLVLEGEAGMGKTTLWRYGVETAQTAGLCVLEAQPAESETSLSFSGLGDLLDPVLDEALAPLAVGQRSALARALVLEDVDGPAPDAHTAGVALLNALRGLCSTRDVLVAVDDVQWLDAASAAALAYATRRLRAERVGLLFSRRAGLESGLLDDLRQTRRRSEVEVGPLDAAALHQVVQGHMGVALPRPLLREVHQASGGNPFYALEIVRMLRRSDVSIEAGQPIPVPDSLHDLVHGRLLSLPPESRDFLLAAAAHAHPTLSITEAASGVPHVGGVTPALEARIVELDGDRIRFTHPLLAAGAYEIADPLRRREIHARLAELLEDPEARAWQLAASVDKSDEAVAAALEDAAHHARARGAPRPAALLLDRARELTPSADSENALRRGVEAAYLHFESGDAPRAEAQLRDLIAPLGAGLQRANALWVLARIRTYEAPNEAAELFLQVVSEAGRSRELLAAAHEGVASSLTYALERLAECARHADDALELARELGDKVLEGDALISKVGILSLLGDPAAAAVAEEAASLQQIATDRRVLDQPLLGVAEYWFWTDAPGRAKETLVDLLRQAEEIGDESARPYLLFLLGEAECVLGDLSGALTRAREGQDSAEQSGQALFSAYNLALQSLAHAQLGDVEQARDAARQAASLAAGTTWYVRLVTSSALGHVEHTLDAPERVLEHLAPTLGFVRREAIGEPCAMRFVVDYVEALVELGKREEAVELLDWYEGNATRLERASALANCARCRGMLAAQAGELDAAFLTYGEALDWHAIVELPLDRGRTLLALGATQRRAKRRREARATLEEALAIFERIGAALWAERARAELARISGRAATPGALTPAEERVAALVAEGKTNREVAAALFLSDRTVEGHLTHVFGKLGIKHRSEVGPALAARQTQGMAAPNTGDSPVSAAPSAP
jgi:DNA-binding CsgD family transcriptional regulator